MTLSWLSPLREGGEARLIVAGAAPYAGIVWRVMSGGGTLTPLATHADAGGLCSARYTAADPTGTTVTVEVDVYA